MPLTLRELDGERATFREALASPVPHTILVTDRRGRCVEVDLMPDGVNTWLLKVSSGERVLFDTGISGARLDDQAILKIIVAAFRALDTPTPSPN